MSDSISGQKLLGWSFGIPGIEATFDFLIVGGGAAGLALANRLSQSIKSTVAVVEAGGFYELDNGINSQVPRYVSTGAGPCFDDVNPLVDWNFETVEEEGRGGLRMHYLRGRTLGGSSARNYLVYSRGTEGSYKMWADAVDDPSYQWENFKPYFDKSVTWNAADMTKRSPDSTPPQDFTSQATSGPVKLSYPNWVMPFTTWAMKATEASGMKRTPGFIGGSLIGTSWMIRTADPKTMIREPSETAYLRPALSRPNLHIYHSTMALKILFENTKANGVLCDTKGKMFRLYASREIIISAGAFQSPQLLMVSGVGPKSTIEKHNIPVVVDLPGVGQGMEDHPFVNIVHKMDLPTSTVLNTSEKQQAATAELLENGTGPLASTGSDVIGDPPDDGNYGGLMGILVNTYSRGSISISSADMRSPPIIHIGYLSDERDQEMIIATFRRMREILAEPALAPVVGPEVFPGNQTMTDQQILEFIHQSAWTVNHVSCTCKMGVSKDRMAVVDSEGRVFGTQGLRVVDVSAMPFLPPGHTIATVYALAEKIADRILYAE